MNRKLEKKVDEKFFSNSEEYFGFHEYHQFILDNDKEYRKYYDKASLETKREKSTHNITYSRSKIA